MLRLSAGPQPPWALGPASEREPGPPLQDSQATTVRRSETWLEEQTGSPRAARSSRTPAVAPRGGKGDVSKLVCGPGCCRLGEMKLHCEVEVISRHLPALGLRNRGKGVRAVLSLCQQTPKSQPWPQAGGERGGPHPACLLISTLKDKRGTRYEVRGASRPCGGVSPGLCPSAERLESVLGVREPPAPEPHHHTRSWVLGLS